MVIIMTEDVVNEICRFCTEHFGDKNNCFGVDGAYAFLIDDEMSGYYPYGEKIAIEDKKLSRNAHDFLLDIVLMDDRALVFDINSKTIDMRLCYNSHDGFQPELSFSFDKTYNMASKDLFNCLFG
jgi:hypothetical protein